MNADQGGIKMRYISHVFPSRIPEDVERYAIGLILARDQVLRGVLNEGDELSVEPGECEALAKIATALRIERSTDRAVATLFSAALVVGTIASKLA
jgi:hypothetical protein